MPILEPPSFLFIHVNQRCNLRCQHCAFWKRNDSEREKYLTWERKSEILREFAELSGDGAVVICGGESMLDLEDYYAISGECRRLGLRCMSVTNGTRIQNESDAERLILSGPTEILVSLNSHREDLHDRTRGVQGAFSKAVNAIRLLVNARERNPGKNTKIYVMALVFDENYRELEAFYDFVLNDLKADKLKLNFLQPSFGWSEPVDSFFAEHGKIDAGLLVRTIAHCNEKFALNLNPVWMEQVGMYFRSLNGIVDAKLGWRMKSRTEEHICNSYRRNIMVDLYGMARLCFSPDFRGRQLVKYGDLRRFWESAGSTRKKMMKCNQFCAISHSVRRESSTLTPNRPKRAYFAAEARR
jgi:MoaA/NifB/PqqE/SkfB family radical SAM enzyme